MAIQSHALWDTVEQIPEQVQATSGVLLGLLLMEKNEFFGDVKVEVAVEFKIQRSV